MTDPEWTDYLVRGLSGLGACIVLFQAARLRYRSREDDGAPADLGLD